MKHVNVYGPKASGKTRNAEMLRKKYGCDAVIESDDTRDKTVSAGDGKRYLLLSIWPVTHPDATNIPIKEALR